MDCKASVLNNLRVVPAPDRSSRSVRLILLRVFVTREPGARDSGAKGVLVGSTEPREYQ